MCANTADLFIRHRDSERISEENVQLSPGISERFQNVLCLSWKLFRFLEFTLLDLEHMALLLLSLETYEFHCFVLFCIFEIKVFADCHLKCSFSLLGSYLAAKAHRYPNKSIKKRSPAG